MMRDRNIQRDLRRARVTREELLKLRDFCGIRDPTPYDAVKNIAAREERDSRQPTPDKNH